MARRRVPVAKRTAYQPDNVSPVAWKRGLPDDSAAIFGLQFGDSFPVLSCAIHERAAD